MFLTERYKWDLHIHYTIKRCPNSKMYSSIVSVQPDNPQVRLQVDDSKGHDLRKWRGMGVMEGEMVEAGEGVARKENRSQGCI